jgi:hypothetical protein
MAICSIPSIISFLRVRDLPRSGVFLPGKAWGYLADIRSFQRVENPERYRKLTLCEEICPEFKSRGWMNRKQLPPDDLLLRYLHISKQVDEKNGKGRGKHISGSKVETSAGAVAVCKKNHRQCDEAKSLLAVTWSDRHENPPWWVLRSSKRGWLLDSVKARVPASYWIHG